MDNLSLPQVDELTEYWAGNPPVHLMVKAFLGIESKAQSTIQNIPEEAELRSLAASFGR